jgi:hypothetical protein
MPTTVIKLDLYNEYDRFSWLYLFLSLIHIVFLSLIHIGFSLPLVKWIMECVTVASLVVLINGSASNFFKSSRRLRSEALTHLLFVDDVLLFCFGSEREGQCFKNIVQLYNKAIGMEINENKSGFRYWWMFSKGINI